jgi:8-oxo-dGTP pyrophosphatase MutT (NUDIX family)
LIQRSKAPGAGLWAFPGGSLEFGEELVTGAQRELLEESGITGTQIPALKGRDVFYTAQAIMGFDGKYASASSQLGAGDVQFHFVLPYVGLEASEVDLGAARPGDDAAATAWVSARALLKADILNADYLLPPQLQERALLLSEMALLKVGPTPLGDLHPTSQPLGSDQASAPLIKGLPHITSLLLMQLGVNIRI